jgi:anti-sigma28 factor (negative regulator of flagellin synthesis)
MRVDDRNLTGAAAAETGRTQGAQPLERSGRTSVAVGRGGAGSDQVELSALSRALQSSDSSRNARVEQLTAQYQAGQYRVNVAQVSHSMVSDALQAPAGPAGA